MARAKRNAKPFTMKMDLDILNRLEHYCEKSGQTKTMAVERAITAYIDEYDAEQKIIEKQFEGAHTKKKEKKSDET